MSIRPIDFQGFIPKTQQMSQENQIANNKIKIEHEYFIQQDKKNVEKQLNRVNEFENKDHPNVKDDQERKKGRGNKKNLNIKKANGEKEQTQKVDQNLVNGIGANIDIKI